MPPPVGESCFHRLSLSLGVTQHSRARSLRLQCSIVTLTRTEFDETLVSMVLSHSQGTGRRPFFPTLLQVDVNTLFKPDYEDQCGNNTYAWLRGTGPPPKGAAHRPGAGPVSSYST